MPIHIPPRLPDGIRIGEKPAGIEFFTRGNNKWILVANALKTLESTATIQIDISGCSKPKIQGMKTSIRKAMKGLGIKKEIKLTTIGNILHCWIN